MVTKNIYNMQLSFVKQKEHPREGLKLFLAKFLGKIFVFTVFV